MRRQLSWLLVGLLALPVLLFATAPELAGAPMRSLAALFGLVLAAGTPGLVVLAVVAYRRRREARPDPRVTTTGRVQDPDGRPTC